MKLDPSPTGTKSPDLRGKRMFVAPADHPRAQEWGKVVDQVPCVDCRAKGHDCGYDDLILEFADGERVPVYEPEAQLTEHYFD